MIIRNNSNIARRIAAGMIDYFFIFTFTFLYIYITGDPTDDGGYEVTGFLSLLPIVVIWLLFTVVFESGLGGTIGNSIAGIRVLPLARKSKRLTFGESLARRLMDPIDMFFFGIVGIIVINTTEKNQRVGDILAKTIVVRMNDTA